MDLIAIARSFKARGILTRTLGEASMQDGLLISIDQFLDSTQAITTIRRAWERRHEVANHLKDVLPAIRQESDLNFETILKVRRS